MATMEDGILSIKIPAGGKIDFHWNTWPASHVGPVLTYAASYTGDIQTFLGVSNVEPRSYISVKLRGDDCDAYS